MAGKYVESDVEIYVDLENFEDDEILDEVEKRVYDNDFLEKVKKIVCELEENLKMFHSWNNQETAKEFFESLSFSESLKSWILKTYKGS